MEQQSTADKLDEIISLLKLLISTSLHNVDEYWIESVQRNEKDEIFETFKNKILK